MISSIQGQTRPVFSIILPTYNRAFLLKRAIQCVLDQTFPDFELIVVDDASSDETEGCVKSFSDSRIQYIRQDANRGVSAARNRGIRCARGSFITFLDDDDESYPDLLAATIRAFESESDEVGFAWSGIRRVQITQEEEIHLKDRQWPQEVKYSQPLLYLSVGTGYGLTVRRGCFDTIGLFDEELRSCVDVDLLIRLGSRFDFTVVPEILIKVYRHQGQQLSDVTPKRVNALEEVVRKNSAILEMNMAAWTRLHDSLAVMHYRLGNQQRGRLIFLKMLGRRPLQNTIWRQFMRREIMSTKVAVKRLLASGKVILSWGR